MKEFRVIKIPEDSKKYPKPWSSKGDLLVEIINAELSKYYDEGWSISKAITPIVNSGVLICLLIVLEREK